MGFLLIGFTQTNKLHTYHVSKVSVNIFTPNLRIKRKEPSKATSALCEMSCLNICYSKFYLLHIFYHSFEEIYRLKYLSQTTLSWLYFPLLFVLYYGLFLVKNYHGLSAIPSFLHRASISQLSSAPLRLKEPEM